MRRDDLPGEPADAVLSLPDRRLVAYRLYGVAEGKPVYFFHGFPGSRLQAALVHPQAVAAGVSLVAFDRPGFGRSDPARAFSVESIASDVFDLSQALGHHAFALLGVSCGGPHALAAARLLPGRVTAVGLLAGIGPMDPPELSAGQAPLLRAMFRLARVWPGLISPLLALDRLLFRADAERALRALASMMTPPDRDLLAASPELRSAFAASLAEAYRHGIGGALQEAGRIARFEAALLDGIDAPVHVYQSGHDVNVPPAMGRYLAQRLPNATYHDCPDEGHLSIVPRCAGDCLRQITRGL